MTAPTREQVLEWAKAADATDEGDIHDQFSYHFWDVQLECFAALAYAAGLAEGARQERAIYATLFKKE